jgi:dihydroneopterin aldolase
MYFFAHHGCFEAERVVGTHFCVNLSFDVSTEKAEISDDISDTVSYLDVYQIVKTEMQASSNLLEHVARRVVNAVPQAFPQISNVCVSVEKLNPSLGGEVGSAQVVMSSERNELKHLSAIDSSLFHTNSRLQSE